MKRPINPGRIRVDPSFLERMAIGKRPVPSLSEQKYSPQLSISPALDAYTANAPAQCSAAVSFNPL
jgi:hypothetical protein